MSDPSKKKDAKQIFQAAIEYYMPRQWEGYLHDACGDDEGLRQKVRGLLDAHRQTDHFFDDKRDGQGEPLEISECPGSQIGPYKLLQEIGEGGFGVVYMAEQMEPVRRKVALKIIKPGMDTKQVIARFEAERQALAMMDHPSIAKVLDAGATASGRPYFVMELVKGVPVTEFCDCNKLSTQERLDLFVTVCRAVQHAHQKGVIHRDLKPSNVMVTLHDNKPMPVIIDFGVSKAISHQLTEKTLFTAYGQMVGTPAYMSPEQAQMSRMDIDTRSDVYSLGVLLYELLTGSTPLGADQLRGTAYAEMQRLIREEEAPKPSTRVSTLGKALAKIAKDRSTDPKKLGQFLRGDLDWIVMKALEKERSRRYDTANGLANDIERFLNDEPVEACPPSLVYQVRKFVGRNRGLVTTASLVLLALLLGTIGTTIGMLKARHDAGVARGALAEADRARDRADTLAAEKQLEADLAVKARQEADRLRDQASSQAANQLMMRASEERARGDITLAALLSAEALRLDAGDPERESIHRRRLAADLRQCPRPTQLLFHDRTVTDARFSKDGKWIVTSTLGTKVRIFDARTGELKQTLNHENSIGAATFLLDDTRLLTQELWPNESDRDKQVKIHLWDWRAGKSLAVIESRQREWSGSAGGQHRSTFFCRKGPHEVQMLSAVDGKPIGPPLTSEWTIDLVRFRSTSDTMALVQIVDPTKPSGDLGLLGTPLVQPARKYQIWQADTGQILTLMELDTTQPRGIRQRASIGEASEDNTLIALGIDRSVLIFNTQTGEEISRTTLHRQEVRPAASGGTFTSGSTGVPKVFSADGQTLLCRQGADIVLLDVETGDVRTRIHTGVNLARNSNGTAILSPDGTLVLAIGRSGHPQLWDASTGQVASSPFELDSGVNNFDFSSDGRYVKVESSRGNVRVWDMQTDQPATPLFRHSEEIRQSAFSPDGSHLLVAAGSRVYLWPVGWPQFSQVTIDCPPAQSPMVSQGYRAHLSPDGSRVLTIWPQDGDRSQPWEARVWDCQTGKELCDPLELFNSVVPIFPLLVRGLSVTFDDENRSVFITTNLGRGGGPFRGASETVAERKSGVIWDLETGETVSIPADQGVELVGSGLSDDGSVAWTIERPNRTREQAFSARASQRTRSSLPGLSRSNRIRIWDARTGEPLGPSIEQAGVSSAFDGNRTISRDASWVVVVDDEGSGFLVLDTRTGEPISETFEHGEGEISSMMLSDDDRRLIITAQLDGQTSLQVRDAENGFVLLRQRSIRLPNRSSSRTIEVDPSSQRFATFFFRMRERRPPRNTIGAMGSDSQAFLRNIAVFDIESDERNLLRHETSIIDAAFSPDGRTLATLCEDQIIRLWDATNGQLLLVLESEPPRSFAQTHFSDDGRRIVATDGRSAVQIWDVATGQPLTPRLNIESNGLAERLRGFPGRLGPNLTSLVSRSADRFVTKSGDRFIVYDLSADSRPIEDLIEITRVLSERSVNKLGNVEALPLLSRGAWEEQWRAFEEQLYERLLPPAREETWHRLQIESSNNGHVTLWHLDRLIDAVPDDGELLRRRGEIHASLRRHADAVADFDAARALGVSVAMARAESLLELERWIEAAEDFEKAASQPFTGFASPRSPPEAQNLFCAGVAYLLADQHASYERVTQEMLAFSRDDRFGSAIMNAIKLALLVPRSAEYCEQLQDRLDDTPAATRARTITGGTGLVGERQLLAYRRGDYETVLAMTYNPRLGSAWSLADFQLLRALSHKQLGRDKQAWAAFREATGLIESMPRTDVTGSLIRGVPRQVTALLLREANETISDSGDKAEAKGADDDSPADE